MGIDNWKDLHGVMLKSAFFKLVLFFIFIFSIQSVNAQIAILNSNANSASYASYHAGNYDYLWIGLINTFDHINVNYSIISDNDINSETLKGYNVLILPLILNLSAEKITVIEDYIKNGGKILVIFPESQITSSAKQLAGEVGIELLDSKQLNGKANIDWAGKEKEAESELPPSTRTASIKLSPQSRPLAFIQTSPEDVPAVTISDKGGYICWNWGQDGTLALNVYTMKNVLNSLVAGIIEKEQTKLDYKDFTQKLEDISKINTTAKECMDSFAQKDQNTIIADIQEHLYLSKMQQTLSKVHYKENDFEKAQTDLKNAKVNALYAYAEAIPSNIVEGRTLWVDRGTIVSLKGPADMSALFDKIQKIGINLVYFETINSGFSIYPGKILEKNPLIENWDPLASAIKEAHKRNIELHAWVWTFAVGNTKHNKITDKSANYAGPILEKNYNLALINQDGHLLQPNQTEYWMDPANSQSKELVKSVIKEIITNYDIDGIQLDYIRYPFQNSATRTGFDTEGREKFETDTGFKLDKNDENIVKIWNNWKADQVSQFVKDISDTMRNIKPNIKISAAVFGGNRQKRLATIQQDWETWVENGWVDILNPMIYASNTSELVDNLDYIVKVVNKKALVYPGIAIRQLDEDDMLDQLFTIDNLGLYGSTLFAMAYLGSEKSDLLSVGPFRYKDAQLPSKNPIKGAYALIEEFISQINELKDSNQTIISEYSIDTVLTQAQKINQSIKQADRYNSDNLAKIISELQNLESTTRNWLISEKMAKTAKGKFLLNYLKESELLLSYELHKQNIKELKITKTSWR